MSVKFLFEDKYDVANLDETTPSSILLKSCFNGDNIYFSNGNHLLKSRLMEIYNKEDVFFVFIDVVPNNAALITLYEHLVMELELDEMDTNVFVLPIPCIEYYLIKMLTYLDLIFVKTKDLSELYNNLFVVINWDNIQEKYRVKSIEKLYKEIINSQRPYCLRNTNRKGNSYYGDFYRISCLDCEGKVCKNFTKSVDYGKEFKAEVLYAMLPIFKVINQEHESKLAAFDIKTKTCSIQEVKNKLQSFYTVLCQSVGENMITVL